MEKKMLKGIDVYHNDPIESFQGNDFVFLKCSEGSNDLDPKFKSRWGDLKRDGITRGAYHFFRPTQGVYDQIARFTSHLLVAGLEDDDIPPALDLDTYDGVSPKNYRDLALIAVGLIQKATKRHPIIYINSSMLKDIAEISPNGLESLPLWLADYSPAPRIHAPWTSWDFWQFSEDGMDKDLFNGDRDALNKLIADSRIS
jgi:lysozyme